jgi:hypothetical protein
LYVHTGLITIASTSPGDWKYVVADWGENKDVAQTGASDKNTPGS